MTKAEGNDIECEASANNAGCTSNSVKIIGGQPMNVVYPLSSGLPQRRERDEYDIRMTTKSILIRRLSFFRSYFACRN